MEATKYNEVPETLTAMTAFYSNAKNAHDAMVSFRWPGGVCCPHCGDTEVWFTAARLRWQCKGCKKQFTAKVGTIFEDSALPPSKWLPAVWLIVNCKNGISSYELHRALGVTQKTAWFMLHRIRQAKTNGSFEKMSGTVEADETFIGGKAKNMHRVERERKIQGRGSVGKAVVMGILERGDGDKPSRVKANVIPGTTAEVLQGEVKAAVLVGAEIMTDAHRGYRGLENDYTHAFIDHAVKYAEGKVHTNSLENFWSLTKRALKGTYVSVEPEHLLAYIDEQAFRFNERRGGDRSRFISAMHGTNGKRLTYHQLIGEPQGIDSPDPLRGGPRAD